MASSGLRTHAQAVGTSHWVYDAHATCFMYAGSAAGSAVQTVQVGSRVKTKVETRRGKRRLYEGTVVRLLPSQNEIEVYFNSRWTQPVEVDSIYTVVSVSSA